MQLGCMRHANGFARRLETCSLELVTLGRVLGAVRHSVSISVESLTRFVDAEAYRLAASLSFYALSSLLPLLLLAIAVGDILLGDSTELRLSLIRLLDVTDSQALREVILGALEGARGTTERSGWGIALGLIGAGLGASGIFLELDTAMEKLFRIAPVKRSVLKHIHRFLLDRGAALLLVVGTCLLLLFGVLILSSVELLASRLRLPAETWPGGLTYLLTLALFVGALTLCFKIVPEPRVPLRAALAGALVATLGLTLVRLPLTWAVTHLTSYSTYGVIGALLVLVTWFYVASCILLFGAAITAHISQLRRDTSAEDQGHDRQDQKHDEQDLRDASRARGNTAETEDRSQQSNHEKNGSPVQHDTSSIAHSSARSG